MSLLAEPRAVEAPPAAGTPRATNVPVPVDNAQIPEIALVALKIYAFGGLAFMMTVVLGALSYWIWVVVIRREFADSPPELELHPERMRKREIERIARHRSRRDRKHTEERHEKEHKFFPPPIILEKKANRPRSSSMPVSGFGASQATLVADTANPRKSSLSTSPAKQNKRVSWASSTSTLDVDGNASLKPLDADSLKSLQSISSPADSPSPSATLPPSPSDNSAGYHAPPPRAHTTGPRNSTALTPRDRAGKDMVSTLTPDIAMSWAQTSDHLSNPCTCATSVDPLDRSGRNGCETHLYTS